jgi:hypothetical protein
MKKKKTAQKKAVVEIGPLVRGGLRIRITNKVGNRKTGTWKTRRRRHELAVADFLTSSLMARIAKYASVTIIIRKRQVQ